MIKNLAFIQDVCGVIDYMLWVRRSQVNPGTFVMGTSEQATHQRHGMKNFARISAIVAASAMAVLPRVPMGDHRQQ